MATGSDAVQAPKPRVALFDNVKGVAIILVVTGHFISRLIGFTESHFMQTALTFIYLFHMPLFLFCSGLFAGKSWYKRREAPADKFLLYLALYLVFVGLIVLLNILVFQREPQINPFMITSAPWFMLVLALFMLLVPVMGSLNPIAFMAGAILLAVASGIYLGDAETLSLSRFFVYLPYFALGFYLQPERIVRLVDLVQDRIDRLRIPLALLALFALFCGMYLVLSDGNLVFLKRMCTGMNLLWVLSNHWDIAMWKLVAIRVILYAIVAAVMALVILACPKDKSFLTFMGERSFQVYIFHMLIFYCIDYFGLAALLVETFDFWLVLPFVLSPALAALLAWPKAPNEWVNALSRAAKRITAPKAAA